MSKSSNFINAVAIIIVCFSVIYSSDKSKSSEKIQNEIEKIDAKLKKIEDEKKSVLNQIYRIELTYERELLKKNKLSFEVKNIINQIKKKEKEKEKLIEKIDKSKDKIKKIIRVLYKQGRHKQIKVFLNSKDFDTLFENYKYFEALISFNNKEIINFRNDIKKLNEIRNFLTIKNIEKQNDVKKIALKLNNLSRIKKSKLSLIEKINNNKTNFTKLRYELEQEFLKFSDKVNKTGNKSFVYSDFELNEMKGKFIWPVKGRLIRNFGKQKSTKFNTFIMNTGIEIKPKPNEDKIRAICSGNIVFADNWKGYGKLIAIQHSKSFLTFYGHCKSFIKKKGDFVKQGEEIAIIGDTGTTKTKSLYFEIRKGLVPKNPINWLNKNEKKN